MRRLNLWVIALALLGCGEDELSGLSWWAGPDRSGSLRDFTVIACSVGTDIDGSVAVTLNPKNPVLSSIRLVFPQNTPNERLLGADQASYGFFHDTPGGPPLRWPPATTWSWATSCPCATPTAAPSATSGRSSCTT